MDTFSQLFKNYLLSQNRTSLVTIKNYLSDLKHFILWYQKSFHAEFNPSEVTHTTIERYREDYSKDLSISQKSIQRHLSCLRKFFQFLEQESKIVRNPFAYQASKETDNDIHHLKKFKDYLYISKNSNLTIKNYIIDIQSFLKWYKQVNGNASDAPTLSESVIEEYKNRLLESYQFSPRTINRKLSSLRRYLQFLRGSDFAVKSTGKPISYLPLPSLSLENLSQPQNYQLEIKTDKTYSPIPPVRLLQQLCLDPYLYLENKAVELLIQFSNKKDQLDIYKRINLSKTHTLPRNLPKSFYSPLTLSTKEFSFWRKISYHLINTRPKWYKKYHNYSFVHYTHLGILIVVSILVAYTVKQNIVENHPKPSILSSSDQGRYLTFEGKIEDSSGNNLSTPSDLRFALYNDPEASDSAKVWEELHNRAKPIKNGFFSLILGMIQPIPAHVFSGESNYYLGISIGNEKELRPRQRISTVSYAQDAELLQSMPPITASNKTQNVLLALDSAGNLSIGGSANPVFQATGGSFTLSGTSLVLKTTAEEDSNIVLAPLGRGKIDLQKEIVNSTDAGVSSGGVEVGDRLAVFASDSHMASFTIENSSGVSDIFAASSSAQTRFVISNTGNVGIGVSQPQFLLDIAGDVRITGSTRLNGISYIWPEETGKSGYVLSTDGIGNLSWVSGYKLNSLEVKNGALYPGNPTLDFLIGGTSTESATFGFVRGNTPTARFNSNITLLRTATQINQLNGGSLNFQTSPGDSSGLVSRLYLKNDGKIGIGTTDPLFRLDLRNTEDTTASAQIYNMSTNSDADGLIIKLGFTGGGSTSNSFIEFQNGAGIIQDRIKSNGAGGVSFLSSGSDFAEYFKKENADEILSPGTLVCLGKGGGVTTCSSLTNNILGVVSEHPGFVGGSHLENDSASVLVALVGQVPVLVSNPTDTIEPGDPISVGSIPGTAEKAHKKGMIVGRTLEGKSANDGKSSITISLSVGWFDPTLYIAEAGSVRSTDPTLVSYFVESENLESQDFALLDSLFKRSESFISSTQRGIQSQLVEARYILATEMVLAKKIASQSLKAASGNIMSLTASTLAVTNDSVTIAGQSLRNYIESTVETYLSNNNSSLAILSPTASLEHIKTGVISPLGDNADIALNLDPDQIRISTSSTASAVVINSEGDAFFSGDIAASSASFLATKTESLDAKDVNVNGTLQADKIVANTIEGLDDKVSSIAGQIFDPESIIKYLQKYQDISKIPNQTIATTFEFLHVNTNLLSLGAATFKELSVLESFSIGNSFIMTASSIDVLGGDLELQPLAQGGISLVAGKVRISVEGNLVVSEDAVFAKNVEVNGTLSTSRISPLQDQDLVVKLGGTNQANHKLRVEDRDGSDVLVISENGDIEASGAATISKLNLSFVAPAYALSDTESVATGSAGTAILKAYTHESTIYNSLVTDKSLIYITPRDDTQNQVLYLQRQNPGRSFTIGVSKLSVKDIPFNWIIVN